MVGLTDLPVEILLEILKRLPVKAVYCIQCVSKTLLEVVDSYVIASLQSNSPSITSVVAESPQLMLRCVDHDGSLDGKPQTCLKSFQCSLKPNISEILSILDEHGYTVRMPFVFNNLICFKKREHHFLVEPFRRQVLKLPPSNIFHTKFGTDKNPIHESYGMGFDSVTSTFKIIRISDLCYFRKDLRVAQVLVLGTSSWHEVPSPPFASDWYGFDNGRRVCAYGDVHWLCQSEVKGVIVKHIVTFDFKKEEFSSTPQPATTPSLLHLRLVTLKGSMAIMDCSSYTKVDIWVMKDYNTKEWTLECSINSCMFDVPYDPSTVHQFACGEWENGILFIWCSPRKLFFFDLRQVPVTCVKFPIPKLEKLRIDAIPVLKHSFLSLKIFGNLIEKTDPGSQTLLDIRWLQPTLKEKQNGSI